MHNAIEIEKEARALLAPFGLVPMGWFAEGRLRGLLVGNIGSSLWPAFKGSPEFSDGKPDPMNRWTENVVSMLAPNLNMEVRFPFGDPIWPFQDYAKQATGMQQSPIGLLVHPEFGLWTAFRAALMFEGEFDIPPIGIVEHPCDKCVEKPCLSTCPINAFTLDGYDYISCKSHVATDEGALCRSGGCLARHACPVGQSYANEPDHQAFHMSAYI